MPEVIAFARRVERLCDFLLGRISDETGRTGSDEQKILEDLKDDASNIQVSNAPIRDTLSGLSDYMGGIPPETKEP